MSPLPHSTRAACCAAVAVCGLLLAGCANDKATYKHTEHAITATEGTVIDKGTIIGIGAPHPPHPCKEGRMYIDVATKQMYRCAKMIELEPHVVGPEWRKVK